MAACPNCSRELSPAARICPGCGHPLAVLVDAPPPRKPVDPVGIVSLAVGIASWLLAPFVGALIGAAAVSSRFETWTGDGQIVVREAGRSLGAGGFATAVLLIVGSLVAVITGRVALDRIEARSDEIGGSQLARAGEIVGWVGVAVGAFGLLAVISFRFLTR